jgi:hypothetical protein
LKKELIHTRKISVNCYETDDSRLIIEGVLLDERLFPFMMLHVARRRSFRGENPSAPDGRLGETAMMSES